MRRPLLLADRARKWRGYAWIRTFVGIFLIIGLNVGFASSLEVLVWCCVIGL